MKGSGHSPQKPEPEAKAINEDERSAALGVLGGAGSLPLAAAERETMEGNESGPAALERPGPGNRKRGSDAGG